MIEGDERATALECWGLRLGMDYQNLLRTLILATHSYCDGDRDVWYIVVFLILLKRVPVSVFT